LGRDPRELFGKDGLIDELKKALSERIPRQRPNSLCCSANGS
jgi:hypothetical protein